MSNATLDISQARKQLNKLDKRLRRDRVVYVTRHGKGAFAVVDIDYLESILETIDILSDPDSAAQLTASLKAIQEGRVIDHEEVKRKYL